MLIQSQTRPQITRHFPVATGVTINEEGLALSAVADGGIAKAQLTDGTSDVFLGVAFNHTMTVTAVPYVADITAVGTTLTLPFTPISGQLRLVNKTEGVNLTAGNPGTTAREYSVSGTTVTLHTGESNDVITVYLKYTPTVDQALMISGEGMPGAQADGIFQDIVGVITKGRVATTCFSIGVAWTAGVTCSVGANGQFLPSGGTALSNVLVAEVPTVNQHYLVLEIL